MTWTCTQWLKYSQTSWKKVTESCPTGIMNIPQCCHQGMVLITLSIQMPPMYKETDRGMYHHPHHRICFVRTMNVTLILIDQDRRTGMRDRPPKRKHAANQNHLKGLRGLQRE